ncbi:MAG: hypothetical protein ACRDXE_11250, partial [Acidimicrobiales bacterium]
AGPGEAILSWLVAPVVSPTGPGSGSTVTTTSLPALTATYSSADSVGMQSYRVVVYAEPTGGWPSAGFDPSTGHYTGDSGTPLPALYDSGSVYSTNPSISQAPVPLQNGILRAYWLVSDAAGSDTQSSPWTFTQWTQAVVGPDPPTMVVSADPAHARVQINLTPAGGTPAYYHVQRSLDDATWVDFIDGEQVAYTGSPITLYDRFAPREVRLWYRAQAVGISSGLTLAGTWGATSAPVVIANDGNDWLISARDATLDGIVTYQGPTLAATSHEDQYQYFPEGRADAVVFAGTIHLEAFISGIGSSIITWAFANDAAHDRWVKIRERQEPCLLKSVFGDADGLEQYWIRIGPDVATTRQGGGDRAAAGTARGTQIRTIQAAAFQTAEPT